MQSNFEKLGWGNIIIKKKKEEERVLIEIREGGGDISRRFERG